MSAEPKKYICKSCGKQKENREQIRDHVKKCQPQWKAAHPDARDPLSTRYRSISKVES